jgi:hypothetical protein
MAGAAGKKKSRNKKLHETLPGMKKKRKGM